MLLENTPEGLIVRTPAKVNLFLEVLGKRPDGLHDLETLMVAVDLFDVLEFRPADDGTIGLDLASMEDAGDRGTLSVGPDNLVCRAAELLRRKCGRRDGVRIRLHKRIPLQAGLAGGSTDAAATLVGLNALWRLGLTNDELMEPAAELGSDVAFFLGGPASWCTGRGEVLTPVKTSARFWFVLLCPTVGLSTASVFRALRLTDEKIDGGSVRSAVERGDVEELGRGLFNRLQPTAEALCPAVAEVMTRSAALGGAGRLMSGSGTTIFVLCRGREDALRAADEADHLKRENLISRVHVVGSLSSSTTE